MNAGSSNLLCGGVGRIWTPRGAIIVDLRAACSGYGMTVETAMSHRS